MAEKEQETKEKVQKVKQRINQSQIQMSDKEPRMVVAPRKKRRGLDVLVEALEHMD